MEIIRTVNEMSAFSANSATKSLGFVPTMGSLHEGHLSLVHRSSAENDLTAVSIFVNPTQFNDPKDFERYPRQTESDIALLNTVKCDVLFLPKEDEIFPSPDTMDYDFGAIMRIWEGEHRPGHFRGVVSVVRRLFEIVRPDRAYFGLKDFQQFLIIRKLVEKYDLGIEILGCEIIRSKDGLALSSRNQLLGDSDRKSAVKLSEALKIMAEDATSKSAAELEEMGRDFLKSFPEIELEYLAVVDPEDLHRRDERAEKGKRRALIAARIGSVRLIDNMEI